MKRVVIVRHAKAVPYGYDDDFNRKLRDRGKNDANQISLKLIGDGIKADLIISSPAKRALKTAEIYAENFRYSIHSIQIEEDLYEGMTTQEFVDLLREISEEVQTVFVFGHNPLVYHLTNNLVKLFNSDMPTCSTVAVDFDVESWKEVSARGGDLAFHLTPRMLK
ncbi:SixA phosphatase family protein [Sunxiuqinia dokdonensis]|uniref:SixA phosphatase family protein n=1 Tax=Sunxiuqinia dokdonensis TaxID=1409788 RepID=UPI00069D5753|nr:histidine phosphatase family protein [Sunxiuqinia dokdonensis]